MFNPAPTGFKETQSPLPVGIDPKRTLEPNPELTPFSQYPHGLGVYAFSYDAGAHPQ